MTDREAASFIITRWLLDHSPTAIMLQLICMGKPVRKNDVLFVIKAYVDQSSENKDYGR